MTKLNLHRIVTTAALGCAVLFAGIGRAQAHQGAGGNLGVGVGIGAPTALSLEVAPTPWSAFELAVGMTTFVDDDLYTHLVYKHDVVRLARGPMVVVPLYLGLGGFVRERNADRATDLGARFPFGVSFDFTRSPMQVFAEGALEATLVSPVNAGTLGIGAFAGARVWF
jgi:hypothetical protein